MFVSILLMILMYKLESSEHQWVETLKMCVFGICGIYFLATVMLALAFPNEKDFRNKYATASAYATALNSDEKVNEYARGIYEDAIDDVNERIDNAREYCDHWYLSPFFSKYIASFEKLEYK